MSFIGLPPIPADLKPLTTFLQRAEETKTQDPIISYWCAYHAAQVGITLKAQGPTNRAFLGALLTSLENIRAALGPQDAIDVESASSAYVENYALRVFTSADNEDRRGAASRMTVKKFVAAAAFLEVLKVFEDKAPWEMHEDKVRYSKWRAADIAKAIREGRKPMPPAGAEPVTASTDDLLAASASSSFPATPSVTTPPAPSSPPSHPPRRVHMSDELEGREDEGFYEAPPHKTTTHPSHTHIPPSPPRAGLSTVGEEGPRSAPVPIKSSRHGRHGSGGSGNGAPPPSPPSSAGSTSSRHSPKHSHRKRTSSLNSPPAVPPPAVVPASTDRRSRTSSLHSTTPSIPPRPPSPTHFVPRQSPPSSPPYISEPPPPPHVPFIAAPPQLAALAAPISHVPIPDPEPPLTQQMIAKAQKHCRFAISALDYEDAEHARKELRAALEILGG
ncbi:DUF605-domain-containing protein [Auriscalpium vulgare]|uniref:DUF605-domain-containing protein n=1 Tax=Auriscalpium vulgare TaxID=40419 RepID=A0ACB8RMD9_9AGAM|nr:DUF605-domain-containing protein [Auriscalpium vulgare]